MSGVASATSYASQAGSPVGLGGNGRIGSFMTGAIVRKDGEPAAVRVDVYDHITGLLVASVFSDAAGVWEVNHLSTSRRFWVRVQDASRELNGAVLDWLQPVPM